MLRSEQATHKMLRPLGKHGRVTVEIVYGPVDHVTYGEINRRVTELANDLELILNPPAPGYEGGEEANSDE